MACPQVLRTFFRVVFGNSPLETPKKWSSTAYLMFFVTLTDTKKYRIIDLFLYPIDLRAIE